jgi:hypothetical protein
MAQNTGSARNDGYSAVLREAVETIRSRDHVHVLTPEGLREALVEPALYRQYKGMLSEGMSAGSADVLGTLFDNFQTRVFQESSLSGIQPISVLTMPMLRKAWPKIGVKEAIPTEPVKTPKFTVSHLIPYIKDPVTGEKKELPKALRSGVASSQKKINGGGRAIPMDAADVMPVGAPVSAGYSIDPVFAIIGVDMEVCDAAGANKETLTNVKVYDGQAETRQGNIRFTVTGAHSSGHETSDTLFGYVDFAGGALTLTSLSGAAGAAKAKITKVYLAGRIESTNNKQSTTISFDIKTTEIHIGTGEHFDAALPLEWLQDNLALYNIDGTLKVVDIMTEVLAQKVDMDGASFIAQCAEKMADQGAGTSFQRTFDIYPTGQYTGSPTEWLNELKRVTDNLAQTMRNYSNFSGGAFMIVGNPIDVNLFTGVNWIFTAQSEEQRDGVEVNYSIGAMSGSQRYAMFTSQNLDPGTLWVFFVPSQEDVKTLQYYPYTFNVERSASGFVSPNTPNVPSVMLTKRQKFQEFVPLVGKINIVNNSGGLPTGTMTH